MGTYVLSFLTLSFSISSILIHFLLTTILSFPPILSNFSFFLSFTMMPTLKPAASWCITQPSSSSKCFFQPAAASGVQLQQAEQEDVRGAIVEEEKEKKGCANFGVFHGWNIPPLAATQ